MVAGQTTDRQRPPVRLYLMITAALPAQPQADALAPLLAEFDIAAVLVRLALAAEREMIDAVKQLAPAVQSAGTALTDDVPVVPARLHFTPGAAELGPACDQCGGMMQRTGACYTCSSCGNNTGCG